jgi:hypothetical protein
VRRNQTSPSMCIFDLSNQYKQNPLGHSTHRRYSSVSEKGLEVKSHESSACNLGSWPHACMHWQQNLLEQAKPQKKEQTQMEGMKLISQQKERHISSLPSSVNGTKPSSVNGTKERGVMYCMKHILLVYQYSCIKCIEILITN